MTGRPLAPLDRYASGLHGIVREIRGGADFIGRLAGMALAIGTRIEVLQNRGHGPLLVRVHETRIALGRGAGPPGGTPCAGSGAGSAPGADGGHPQSGTCRTCRGHRKSRAQSCRLPPRAAADRRAAPDGAPASEEVAGGARLPALRPGLGRPQAARRRCGNHAESKRPRRRSGLARNRNPTAGARGRSAGHRKRPLRMDRPHGRGSLDPAPPWSDQFDRPLGPGRSASLLGLLLLFGVFTAVFWLTFALATPVQIWLDVGMVERRARRRGA